MSKEYDDILKEVHEEKRKQRESDQRARDIIKGAVKEALSESGQMLTKDDILKEPNQHKRQQMIRENMDLFRK